MKRILLRNPAKFLPCFIFIIFIFVSLQSITYAEEFVMAGSTWKYLDNGTNQGTSWRSISFDDSSWASGRAQLGYGDGDEVTVVSYGLSSTNKYITTYLRYSFNVSDPSSYSSLTLRLLRDDGAVVYLNGMEVFRNNLPDGTISYTTLASSAVTDSAESTFYETNVNSDLLVAGTNVLAVELHQASASSSDISFDLDLFGNIASTTLVPAGSTWSYLDNGTNQEASWVDPSFNDAGWASGPAQLGYGDGDEATVVSYGPNASDKYITTYLRYSFNVSDPSSYSSLTLRLLRDDGAVVYLNGMEVFRSNLPAGTISDTTLASSAVVDSAESTFYETNLNSDFLVAGTNVLAVELHQASVSSTDISFDLELLGKTGLEMVRGPYLQMGTSESTVVRWRTNAPADSRVRYGLSPLNLSGLANDPTSTTEHVVTLTGLSPNTKYYYSIESSVQSLAGADPDHFFMTAPAAGESKPTRIWVIGDSGTADFNARAVRDAYFTYTGSTYTDLWLMLGDNAYSNGTDSEYQAALFDTYPTLLRQTVLWPTIGNHDTASSTNPPSTIAYYNIFTLPTNAQAGGIASGTEDYYSFDYGNIHFVCLDSMTSDRTVGGPMLTWLQNDLTSTTKDWIIAFWHHPPYTKGSHDSDTEAELREMRENVLPILETYGVDLVLSGHSHSYERSFLLDGHYGTSDTFTSSMILDTGSGRPEGTGAYTKPSQIGVPHQGAVYVVAGSSGKMSGGSLNHPAMFTSLNNLGSLVLDINGNRLNAKFLTETGTITDFFTILKGGAANEPPSVSVTSPMEGKTYAEPASVTISANASDSDGSVTMVKFFSGVTLIGTDVTSPYGVVWSNVLAGKYTITAETTDDLGSITTSSPVHITVNPARPAAPSNLTATAVSKSQINLSWKDNALNESGFKIERYNAFYFYQIATVGSNVRTFSNTGLYANRWYYYRVRAYNSIGNSSYSNTAAAKTIS